MGEALVVTEVPTAGGDAFIGSEDLEEGSVLMLVLIIAVTFALTACVCVFGFFCLFTTKKEERVLQLGNYLEQDETKDGGEVQMHEIDVQQTKQDDSEIQVYETRTTDADYQPHMMATDAGDHVTPGMGTLGGAPLGEAEETGSFNPNPNAYAYGTSEGTVTRDKRDAATSPHAGPNFGGARYDMEAEDGDMETFKQEHRREPANSPGLEGGVPVTGIDLVGNNLSSASSAKTPYDPEANLDKLYDMQSDASAVEETPRMAQPSAEERAAFAGMDDHSHDHVDLYGDDSEMPDDSEMIHGAEVPDDL